MTKVRECIFFCMSDNYHLKKSKQKLLFSEIVYSSNKSGKQIRFNHSRMLELKHLIISIFGMTESSIRFFACSLELLNLIKVLELVDFIKGFLSAMLLHVLEVNLIKHFSPLRSLDYQSTVVVLWSGFQSRARDSICHYVGPSVGPSVITLSFCTFY